MDKAVQKKELTRERIKLLRTINDLIDRPLTYLSFVWFGIIVYEFTVGASDTLEYISLAIWALFVLDFVIEILIAPSTRQYLKENWLLVLTLLLPALRIVRIFSSFRMLRTLRSLNLLKMIASLNRSLVALKKIATSYGLRYLFVFTTLVLAAGAAGILFFENSQALADRGIKGEGINSYMDALWWSIMLMTTIGSQYWPQSVEGRILTVVLSLYAIAIFGYITAMLASLLIKKGTAIKE